MNHRFDMRSAGLLVLICTLMVLAGCSVLPQSQTLTLYRLPMADKAQGESTAPLPVSLLVRTPYAGARIDSTYVLVVPPQSSQISTYGAVRWSDTAPVLVRDRLARAFRVDGRLEAVSVDAGLFDAQLELAGELNAFQVEYPDNVPTIHIRFDVVLLDVGKNKNMASRTFEIIEPVGGKEVPEVVEAFGRASDRLADQVVAWALEQAVVPGAN